MAKILVADDNSNVQKTVALALGDMGVKVEAVNNGDAAVRKLPDVLPDLVLADIFMPVRNGYEVCEFVKKDPRFAHVPVVLLVGAFDPLDEREAQRVGADGILKKPFVPPEPLITMVKTLLDRSNNERLVAVEAPKPAPPVSVQSKAGGNGSTVQARPAPAAIAEEPPVDEIQPPPGRVSFGEGERPIAFGDILDAAANDSASSAETIENEQVLTSARDAALGEPIFWKTEEPESSDEEAASEEDETADNDLTVRSWGIGNDPLPRALDPIDEPLPEPVAEIVAPPPPAEPELLQPIEPYELVHEQVEQDGAPTNVEPSLIIHDPASQSTLTVSSGKAEDLAANPLEWMATVPPPQAAAPSTETTAEPAEDAADVPEAAPDWSAALTEGAETLDVSAPYNLDSALEAASHAIEPAVSIATPATEVAPVLEASTEEQISESIVAPEINSHGSAVIEEHTQIDLSAEAAAIESHETQTQPHFESLQIDSFAKSAEEALRSMPKREWADLAASLLPKPGESAPEIPLPPPGTFTAPLAAATPATELPVAPATSLSSEAALTEGLFSAPLAGSPGATELPVAAPDEAASIAAYGSESTFSAPLAASMPSVPNTFSQSAEETVRSIPRQEWADLAATLQLKPIVSGVEEAVPVAPSPEAEILHQAETHLAHEVPTGQADPPAWHEQNSEPVRELPLHESSIFHFSMQKTPAAIFSPAPNPAATSAPAETSISIDAPAVAAPPTPAAATFAPPPPPAFAPIPSTASSTQSAPASPALPPAPDPALIEAVVNRVLEKMRPQVVDIITKEFLRPVVQALVHREITKSPQS